MSPLHRGSRRAGLYLRISRDRAGVGLGVDRQREDGERLIAQRGWVLHETYVDNDISGSGRRKRPAYLRLLHDIEHGIIDATVARSIERLFKARREQLTFMELGQQHMIDAAFTHAPDIDFTTAVGRGIADMQAAWARVEMEQKGERHRDQIAQAAAAGKFTGGRRPFGYQADGLSTEPFEAALLVQLYDRWLTGESLRSLCAWLNNLGVRTPRGNTWRHHSLREVLANPRNAGLRGMRDVVNHRTGTRAQWHRIIGPAVWPGVVSEATWQATMERLRDPSRPGAHVGSSQRKHLLSGIARCGVELAGGECGEPLITGSRAHVPTLTCRRAKHLGRRADYIEDYVTEQLLAWFSRPDVPDLGGASGDGDPDAELEALRRRSVEARARLDGLAADYADGVLDREQVRVTGDRLRGELAELDQAIARLGQVDVTAPLRAATDPWTVWDTLPLLTRREVVRRTLRVTVLRGTPGRRGGARFQPDTVRIEFLT